MKIAIVALIILLFTSSLYAHTSRVNRSFRLGIRILGGTPDSLLFIDLNNKIAEDNANLSWDDTNNRLTTDSLLIQSSNTPTSAAATGITGQIEWDTSYIYVCVTTDTWKRTAITTWSDTFFILLDDGASNILLDDGASKILGRN